MAKAATAQSPLLQLVACGQSYWLDNLTRPMIQSGELEKRVLHQGLRGITANPATFHKAITGSDAYDSQIKALAREGVSLPDIYEGLAVKDVQDACDILREVHEATDGLDGFVSLEVSPHLAYDAQETMREARRLADLVNRPNVYIKIPGTAAGVPAIEQMLYEGVNVNITLLFSVASYQAVAYAYVRALEHRLHVDRSVRAVSSVASFFLSRIDVLVDQLLQQRIGRRSGGAEKRSSVTRLLGKVAIANAKVAYQSFKRIFSEDRWTVLETQGARVQRPLWASTGVKNQNYRDVCYVEPLVGPHTVTTMPEQTIEAFADHGHVVPDAIEKDMEEAYRVLQELSSSGVDFDRVTWQLEHEGVQKFIEPYDALMQSLEEKRRRFIGRK